MLKGASAGSKNDNATISLFFLSYLASLRPAADLTNSLLPWDFWAALTPDEKTKMNRKREKNTYSQTSRLENPEEFQLHHNHENLPCF
jgi:hypothetical protein